MVTNRYFNNPWITNDVKKLSDARKKYHSLFIAGIVSHSEYASYRNKVTALIRKLKVSYYKQCFSRNANNMKASWNLIRKICSDHNVKNIEKIKYNDHTYNDDMQMATIFL